MYNNTSYEEYMRTVLGYMPNNMQDTYADKNYYITQNNFQTNNCNIEDLYPDIYRKMYPEPRPPFQGGRPPFMGT